MAMDFPNSPSISDTYTASGRTWVWNGTTWTVVAPLGPTGPTGATGSTGATGPTGPVGPNVAILRVTNPSGSQLTVGDGQAYLPVPAAWNGLTITSVVINITTVSSSGLVTVNLYNVTDSVDVLSTPVTIDVGEYTSTTATTPAVISNGVLATDDRLRVDIDVAGTGAKGLTVTIVVD